MDKSSGSPSLFKTWSLGAGYGHNGGCVLEEIEKNFLKTYTQKLKHQKSTIINLRIFGEKTWKSLHEARLFC